MKTFKDKFLIFTNVVIKSCFSLFCFIYATSNIIFTYYAKKGIELGLNKLSFIFLVLFLLIIYISIKKDFFGIKEKHLLILSLSIIFIIGLIWIFINDPLIKEFGDSYNCFSAAKEIAKNNYEPLSYKSYLSTYPNNIGFVMYLLVHIKLFGEYYSLYSVRLVNLFMVILGYYSLYGISKKSFNNNRTVNCLTILLMMLNMQYVFYAFMIYGNCLSYSLALFSVYCLLCYFKSNKNIFLLISIITITISITIKENSLIVLLAEMIFMFLYFLKNKKKIVVVAIVIMLFGSYIGTTGLQKFWGNKVNIDYEKIKLPTICWLAYGLNYDQKNPGAYTLEFETFHVENGYVQEYTKLKAKEFINNAFNTFKKKPTLFFKFCGQKFLRSWADPQYDAFNGYEELDNNSFVESVIKGSINKVLSKFWDASSSVIALGLLYYVFKNFKKIELSQMLCATIVFGGFLFHSFWEIKSIYLYQYFMYLIPYAAYGIYLFIQNRNNYT